MLFEDIGFLKNITKNGLIANNCWYFFRKNFHYIAFNAN